MNLAAHYDTIGILASMFSLAVLGWRKIGAPLVTMKEEHDLLWEDYNIRRGGPYRVKHGRNGIHPEQPEETLV